MEPIVLKNDALALTFDGDTGALCGVYAPALDWNVLDREQLGQAFRLLVPLGEELRNNSAYGREQRLAASSLEGNRLTLEWRNITTEHTGALDITVRQVIELDSTGALWRTEVENRSPYTVETVYSPYLGDVRHPAEDPFTLLTSSYATAREVELWPRYQNLHGYYGVDYPTQFLFGGPTAPFALLRTGAMGLYCGVEERDDYELVAWHTELRPGYGNSIDMRVPREDEIAGKPVHTRFAAVHEPYVLPGESRRLTTLRLEPYAGDWHAGVDIYKRFLNSWMEVRPAPAWAARPHAWQQLHINSPEDELRLRFVDLPEVARECKAAGVAAIQLVGWNYGGQDQGNPCHDPDPRLGTFAELREAIAQCEAMGVHIILFTKFPWADMATPWYRNQLKEYAISDPYGDPYPHGGYQYQTATQLLDINTKRFVPMCFYSEEYLRICEQEFAKVVALGASGMLYDECQHHSVAKLCFSDRHGHRYGAPVYRQDNELIRRLRPLAPGDFLVGGEACYDLEMQQYQLAYFRTESLQHLPLYRYALPRAQYMTAVTGFDDRDMVNQCLLYRYIISYEPYNFKGRLPDYPATVAYGRRMDELRTELAYWFWDGECLDTCGGTVVDGRGIAHRPYSVFRAQDGSLALAVANYGDAAVSVRAQLTEDAPLVRWRLVDGEDWHSGEEAELPPHSAAVFLPR